MFYSQLASWVVLDYNLVVIKKLNSYSNTIENQNLNICLSLGLGDTVSNMGAPLLGSRIRFSWPRQGQPGGQITRLQDLT